MPATSIFISAASSAISGIGNTRISVLLGAVRTAARTFSLMASVSHEAAEKRPCVGGRIRRHAVPAAVDAMEDDLRAVPAARRAEHGDRLAVSRLALLGLGLH